MEDSLATLPSMFKVRWANQAYSITIMRLDEPTLFYEVEEETDEKPYFYDIKRYLEMQEYPKDVYIINKKTL